MYPDNGESLRMVIADAAAGFVWKAGFAAFFEGNREREYPKYQAAAGV